MKEIELNKYQLKDELEKMAISCIGVKEATAKNKASKIFKKYSDIISYSSSDHNYYEKQYNRYKHMLDVLKSGKINYSGSERKGVILIRDINQVEVRKTDVLVIMKSGREITMGLTFEFLTEIL